VTTTSSTLSVPLPSTSTRRVGLALGVLAIVLLLADGLSQLLALSPVIGAAAEIGWPVTPGFWQAIGAVLVASTLLYAIPRTAVFGAVLITGYLGAAIGAHVRVGQGAVPPVVAALVIAAVVWGALWLRDPRVRALTGTR
jgi:hypothetical protein